MDFLVAIFVTAFLFLLEKFLEKTSVIISYEDDFFCTTHDSFKVSRFFMMLLVMLFLVIFLGVVLVSISRLKSMN